MKNQIKNLPEFIKLIERYETITLEEIEEQFCDSEILTGFGDIDTCSLCLAIDSINPCPQCVYIQIDNFKCHQSGNSDTYHKIRHAKTPKQLLTAYRNRAKHMRSVLEKLNIEMP